MIDDVKVILFDTFGTVSDWRSSITRQCEALAKKKGLKGTDWEAFARAWRAGYRPGLQRITTGERPFVPIDVIHRERLDEILLDFDLDGAFNEDEKAKMVTFWHTLDPWPDSVPGLRRIKSKFLIGPLSNGSLLLLTTMAKRAGIPWDFILSSDMHKAYKRDPKVYQNAVHLLGLEAAQVMMGAAHNDDLEAARAQGLRTCYVNRPSEYGADQVRDFEATDSWDVIADDFEELATKLGC